MDKSVKKSIKIFLDGKPARNICNKCNKKNKNNLQRSLLITSRNIL